MAAAVVALLALLGAVRKRTLARGVTETAAVSACRRAWSNAWRAERSLVCAVQVSTEVYSPSRVVSSLQAVSSSGVPHHHQDDVLRSFIRTVSANSCGDCPVWRMKGKPCSECGYIPASEAILVDRIQQGRERRQLKHYRTWFPAIQVCP